MRKRMHFKNRIYRYDETERKRLRHYMCYKAFLMSHNLKWTKDAKEELSFIRFINSGRCVRTRVFSEPLEVVSETLVDLDSSTQMSYEIDDARFSEVINETARAED